MTSADETRLATDHQTRLATDHQTRLATDHQTRLASWILKVIGEATLIGVGAGFLTALVCLLLLPVSLAAGLGATVGAATFGLILSFAKAPAVD